MVLRDVESSRCGEYKFGTLLAQGMVVIYTTLHTLWSPMASFSCKQDDRRVGLEVVVNTLLPRLQPPVTKQDIEGVSSESGMSPTIWRVPMEPMDSRWRPGFALEMS